MTISKENIQNHFAGDYLPFYRAYLENVKPGKDGEHMACCCFHNDKTPSLSFNQKTGAFYCHGCKESGGDIFDFFMKFKSCNFQSALSGIASDFNISNGASKKSVETVYDYRNEAGTLLYQVLRYKPKDFRQRRPDGKGGWIWNLQGVKPAVLYRLPEIIKAEQVLVVEGEKDADNLAALGFSATCNSGGAGKWRDEYSDCLKGKDIIIIPDQDEPGRKHGEQVAASLQGKARSIKMIQLAGVKDVSDFINTFKDDKEAAGEALSILIDGAKEYEIPQTEKRDYGFNFRSAYDLCKEPNPIEWIIKPYMDEESMIEVFGEPGAMKSFLATDIGLSIASGKTWHGNPIKKKGPVFYIPGEGFAGINKRIKAWAIHHKIDLESIPFFVSGRPAQLIETTEDLFQDLDILVRDNGKPVLIVLDTLNRNFGPGDENATQDMTRFISACDMIRARYSCAIMIIHHSGLTATDRARGASALKAALDWEYKMQTKANGIRLLTCTKVKDHTEPLPLSFIPKTIELDWLDPDDGERMTSCVLCRLEGETQPDSVPLKGARKIAFEALASFKGESTHIDEWRTAAYSAGITASSSYQAKKKAFQRAVLDLLTLGYVETSKDYYWPRGQGTFGGHLGDMSPDFRGTTGDTPL